MLNDNAKKWVAALRSGKYKQGQSRLREGNKFCCLGVACDLYKKMTGNGKWDENLNFRIDKEIRSGTLPSKVREWLGLCSDNPDFASGEVCLTEKNDHGSNFSEIAEIIESEPEGLFKK